MGRKYKEKKSTMNIIFKRLIGFFASKNDNINQSEGIPFMNFISFELKSFYYNIMKTTWNWSITILLSFTMVYEIINSKYLGPFYAYMFVLLELSWLHAFLFYANDTQSRMCLICHCIWILSSVSFDLIVAASIHGWARDCVHGRRWAWRDGRG